MTIQVLREIKRSKVFYRNSFRKVIVLLFFSLVLNSLLCFGIYSRMINSKPPAYYSTSGLTPPVPLTPLLEPNYSSKALLKSAPENDDGEVMMSND